MRIDSSNIKMASFRSFESTATETNSTITKYYGNGFTNTNINSVTAKTSLFQVEGSTAMYSSSKDGIERTDKNDISHKSAEVEDLTQNQQNNNLAAARNLAAQLSGMDSFVKDFDFKVEDDPEIVMLKRMLEMLNKGSGKKCTPEYKNEIAYRGLDTKTAFKAQSFSFGVTAVSFGQNSAVRVSAGENGTANGRWTRQTVVSGFVAGEEHTAYSSVGSVVTSDGRTIDFNITLEMSHSFAAAYESISAEEEFVLTDPLVINLGTDSAEISDVSFYFDLDSDGIADKMSSLGGKSGFLALDKNGDGVINNGTELFGAKTGDGFGELSQYDDDGNGWIDESDSVFKSLSVWVNAGQNEARLLSLSEAGVGAIFLGSQKTQAVLADGSGFEGARIAKTGVFLRENGTAGTVQHIDFKI